MELKNNRRCTGFKERFAWVLFRNIPFPILYGITGRKLIIPCYHLVSDEEVLHTKHLYRHKGVLEFRQDIEFLLRHFKPISVSDLIEISRGEKRLSDRSFLLTFDDGFKDTCDHVVPILQKKGVPACFFIPSAFIDNKELSYDHKKSLLAEIVSDGISRRQESEINQVLASFGKYNNGVYESILSIGFTEKHYIDQLADIFGIDFHQYLQRTKPYLETGQISELIRLGFGIGAHSIDHPLYSQLTLEEQLGQTVESVKTIRETFGIKYGAFAFPHTDTGVKSQFFSSLNESGWVDISFGGRGFMKDEVRTHFQRLSFENPPLPAERLIKVESVRALLRGATGRGEVRR